MNSHVHIWTVWPRLYFPIIMAVTEAWFYSWTDTHMPVVYRNSFKCGCSWVCKSFYVCKCECAHSMASMSGLEDNLSIGLHLPSCFAADILLSTAVHMKVSWTEWFWGFSCLYLPTYQRCTGITNAYYDIQLYVGPHNPNSSPHTCGARALPTEPSPSLHTGVPPNSFWNTFQGHHLKKKSLFTLLKARSSSAQWLHGNKVNTDSNTNRQITISGMPSQPLESWYKQPLLEKLCIFN